MNLKPGESICDPACGTAGFLLAAYTELRRHRLSKSELDALNTGALTGVELVDGVARRAENRLSREATFTGTNPPGRWRSYGVEELLARDKASLDLFWLRDESLSDGDNLPPPEVIAAELIDDLQAALDQLRELKVDITANAGRFDAS